MTLRKRVIAIVLLLALISIIGIFEAGRRRLDSDLSGDTAQAELVSQEALLQNDSYTEKKMHRIGRKYGTDKIWHHHYDEIYPLFLQKYYESAGSMLEIGVEDEKSIRMWLELFPRAHVFGVDIHVSDKGERYEIIEADQSDETALQNVKNIVESASGDLFFINDDGSHVPEHQLLTFNVLFPSLREGGIYIIEDVETSYWTKSGLYGYETRYGYKHSNSIVEIFKDVADSINSEFAGDLPNRVMHHDSIGSMTFSQNCIIIIKKEKLKRVYRFADKTNLNK